MFHGACSRHAQLSTQTTKQNAVAANQVVRRQERYKRNQRPSTNPLCLAKRYSTRLYSMPDVSYIIHTHLCTSLPCFTKHLLLLIFIIKYCILSSNARRLPRLAVERNSSEYLIWIVVNGPCPRLFIAVSRSLSTNVNTQGHLLSLTGLIESVGSHDGVRLIWQFVLFDRYARRHADSDSVRLKPTTSQLQNMLNAHRDVTACTKI